MHAVFSPQVCRTEFNMAERRFKIMSAVFTLLLSLILIILIGAVKKRSFVTPNGIGLTMHLFEESIEESFVFPSLYCAGISTCFRLHRTRNLMLLLLLLGGDVERCPGPSSITRGELKQMLSNRGLKMVHQNISSLQNNYEMLQEFISSHNETDIVSLSETHFALK